MNQDIFVLIEHLRGQLAEISFTMLAASRSLVQETSGSLIAILLGHNVDELAHDLAADQVWSMDHPSLAEFNPDLNQQALKAILANHAPRLMLFGDTSTGAGLAGPLSIQLGLPLVSNCYRLSVQEGVIQFTSQVCGGKLMVAGELPGPTALVTMIPGGYKPEEGRSEQAAPIKHLEAPAFTKPQLVLKQYIEADTSDVDIAKENLLVAVGRGIQSEENLQLALDLADELGGVVCSSRPVVDQGWLPTSRLVGKSGKHVKPKVYLALGISGAPEHVEAIEGSEMIIAINTDPDAPIFNLARYGANVDLFDLVPVLIEALKQAHSAPVS